MMEYLAMQRAGDDEFSVAERITSLRVLIDQLRLWDNEERDNWKRLSHKKDQDYIGYWQRDLAHYEGRLMEYIVCVAAIPRDVA